LPYWANQVIPYHVLAMLPANSVPLLIHEPDAALEQSARSQAGE
jgi:hypothetical protein